MMAAIDPRLGKYLTVAAIYRGACLDQASQWTRLMTAP
jgi:hypothetical protein